jgi:hypothetical protein
VFHYRDRYRQARKGRLLANMRRDSAFVEIGPEAWSLRCWHEDELSTATEQADQLAPQICKVGGKNNVASMLRDGGASQREVFLVVDCLRRDDRVRSLGRGDFCPATSTRSQVLEELMRDFRSAMGEVPLSRFLDNQPPGRRRLVDSLLHENRLFVQPSPDRIDVLTNYPFNEERMALLLKLSREYLDKAGGYSTLSALRAVVNETDLGGGWLGDHLLGDLLRRQGSFEMLPGEILAEPELELGGWIQARARDALRCASMPMTVDEILVEEPELAEFSDCMRELLRQDPMVQTADGRRYQVV